MILNWTRLAKCYFFFVRKIFQACRVNRSFRYHKYYPALQEDNLKILQFFCHDYFEDLLAPITYAKNFGFLADVFSKIFANKNALATNRNVLLQQACNNLATNRNVIIEIITIKKSIFE